VTLHSSRKVPIWLLFSLGCYGATLAALTLLNRFGADRWWPGACNLYLPQSIWLFPGLLLCVLCLKLARRWAVFPLLCLVWVSLSIMGFCWPLAAQPKPAAGIPLRVMTWNIKYAKFGKLAIPAMLALLSDIDRNRPDLLIFQEAGGALDGPLGAYLKNWQVRSHGEFIVASRFPLLEPADRRVPLRGKHTFAMRCRLQIGPDLVSVYNVHFESPRDGLGSLLAARKNLWTVPKAAREIKSNASYRLVQARLVRESLAREPGPVIVAGDLNSPDSSQACAELRGAGLHDAFAEAGRGYGFTYGHFLYRWIQRSWMRIDHVMMSRQLSTLRSWTGTGKASEHRPVIADLVLSSGP
jgi:vancomycin resistance protein VanJ